MKQNFGYRVGTQTRRFMRWLSMWENEMQQWGVPRWVTKMPLYLCIAAAVGLLLAGAFFIVGFLALMAFIAFFLAAMSRNNDAESSDEYLTGYHAMGPEGPGTYVAGKKVSDDDEELS